MIIRNNLILSKGRLLAGTVAALVLSTNIHAETPQSAVNLVSNVPVAFAAGVTLVSQKQEGVINDSALTYSVDLAFEADLGDHGAAFISVNSAQGDGIDTGATAGSNGDAESGLVNDAEPGFSETRIAEVGWVFPAGKMTEITLGKIDPTGIYDANEVANDETSQFLADVFVGNAAIAFPGYAAGLSVGVHPTDDVALDLGLFEPTADFVGSLDGVFAIGEASLAADIMGQAGNLRVGYWEQDTDQNKGFYINIDQAFGDTVSGFLRVGQQEDDQPFDNAVSFGGMVSVKKHNIGFAIAQLETTDSTLSDEKQQEIFWRYACNDMISTTLDFQQISNAGFAKNIDDIKVVGFRLQIDI